MRTTSQGTPNQSEQTTPSNPEITSENTASIYSRSREALRVSRTTILGVRYYPGQLAQEVWSHAAEEGEALAQQKSIDISTKSKAKQKSSRAKPETTKKDDTSSFFSKALARTLSVKRGVSGSFSLYAQSRKMFLEDSIENGRRIKHERATRRKEAAGIDTTKDTGNDVEANNEQASRTLSKVFDFRRGFLSTLSNRTSAFTDELKKCGKSQDLSRRQKAAQKRLRRRESFEAKLSLIGITTHKELQDLNRRMTDLINATSQIATQSDSNIIQTLERRQGDRRIHTNAINYEMRVYSRRDMDHRAA